MMALTRSIALFFVLLTAAGLWLAFGSVVALLIGLLLAIVCVALTENRPPIMRNRVALGSAITLTGVLAGEIAGMHFLQDPPGRVMIDRMSVAALLGGVAGAVVAAKVDQLYANKPGSRRLVTLFATVLLCTAVGGALGWFPGEYRAIPQSLTDEERIRIIRTGIGICAAIGLGVGLVLGTIAFALKKGPPTEEPPVNEEDNPHDQPR